MDRESWNKRQREKMEEYDRANTRSSRYDRVTESERERPRSRPHPPWKHEYFPDEYCQHKKVRSVNTETQQNTEEGLSENEEGSDTQYESRRSRRSRFKESESGTSRASDRIHPDSHRVRHVLEIASHPKMSTAELTNIETTTKVDPIPKQPPDIEDTKDDEEQRMIDEINALFEQYRTTEDLKFDISKKQKAQILHEIKRKIKSIIDTIDIRYAYKLTLNIPVRLKNGSNHKNKQKKKGSTNTPSATNNGTTSATTDSNQPNPSTITNTTTTAPPSATTTTTRSVVGGGISRALYLYFLGRYHFICGNLSVSSPLLQESIKADPEITDCWNTLGDLYYEEGEVLAAKFCFESALDFDRFNKIAYISLSKMLRKPTGKDQMEIMENCVESLVLAKQALKFGRRKGSKSNALKDGELWFNLGNAYLMAFLNCINGFKLESSRKLQEEEAQRLNPKNKGGGNGVAMNGSSKLSDADSAKQAELEHILDGLDEGMFAEERAQEAIYSELRREIEQELRDEGNDLLHHVYIRKCLSAYKCAATKCSVNRHCNHPDLFCNRSHLHIYQEHFEEALADLRQSIRFSAIECGKGHGEESQAQIVHDALLPKLVKMTKQIANRGGAKMAKKIQAMSGQIRNYTKQCSDYYTAQCHYDLVHFKQLAVGLNGGTVMVLKILGLMQPSNQMPFHFMSIDDRGSMFVLSFYLRGHALSHLQKVLNQPTVISAQTLISVANPVKRRIKFSAGNKHIDFHTVTFQKPEDICIGGKFFFNQK